MVKKENKITSDSISFSDMRKEGWKISWTYQKGPYYFLISIMICGIFSLLGILDSILCIALGIEGDSLLPRLVTNILSIIFSIGVLAYSFDLINGINAKIKNFWKGLTWNRIRSGVLGSILTGIFIGIGFVLLVIPGIIVSIRLIFVLYAVVDKGLDPIEAIKYSWDITKGHFREIIGFELYFFFFNIVGMLCLGVGLIRTGAMTQLATVRYYKSLSEIYDNKLKETNKVKKHS